MQFKADDWGEQARTEIQHWLRDKVRPLYFNDNGACGGPSRGADHIV
jgi:hypothetical protein